MNRVLTYLSLLCGLLWVCPTQVVAENQSPALYVQNYSVSDYHASCQNWDVAIAPWGTLYVANNSGLLSFDGNTWICHQTPEKMPVKQVTISHDTIYTCDEKQHAYWTYDEVGNLHYQPLDEHPSHISYRHPVVHCPLPPSLQHLKPTACGETDRYFFIGTEQQGLIVLNRAGEWLLTLDQDNLLQDNMVRNLVVQDHTRLWVVFDNGISCIDIQPPFTMLGKRREVGKLVEAALCQDSILIQTNIGYFKRSIHNLDDTFRPIPAEEAHTVLQHRTFAKSYPGHRLLKEQESLGAFSEAEEIYPTSQEGLYWLTVADQVALAEENQGHWSIKGRLMLRNYDMHLVTSGTKLFPLNDTLCLVSTMEGPLLLQPLQLISSGLGSFTSPRFRRIAYMDEEGTHLLHPHQYRIQLPNDFKALRLSVSTTIFTPIHQISYWLDGVSTEWSEWQTDGKMTFLQLPTGQYKLHVRKYVVEGPFPELTLDIEVRPAWYKTVWAYVGYLILGWFILLMVIRRLQGQQRIRLQEQQRKLKEQQEIQRQQEEQRLQQLKNAQLEAELQNKNNELTLQTTALVKRNQAIQSFLTELEQQKETLGDRYPNKLYNRLRSLMEDALNDQADWLQFETYFNSAHHDFMDRLRQQYADLTTGDLRICCLLRMNLSTKEIASLLNVSIRAIEVRRYRLRKRMNLDNDTNLVDFLLKF